MEGNAVDDSSASSPGSQSPPPLPLTSTEVVAPPPPVADPASCSASRQACWLCRERKQKCDGQRPCSRCVGKEVTCTTETPPLGHPIWGTLFRSTRHRIRADRDNVALVEAESERQKANRRKSRAVRRQLRRAQESASSGRPVGISKYKSKKAAEANTAAQQQVEGLASGGLQSNQSAHTTAAQMLWSPALQQQLSALQGAPLQHAQWTPAPGFYFMPPTLPASDGASAGSFYGFPPSVSQAPPIPIAMSNGRFVQMFPNFDYGLGFGSNSPFNVSQQQQPQQQATADSRPASAPAFSSNAPNAAATHSTHSHSPRSQSPASSLSSDSLLMHFSSPSDSDSNLAGTFAHLGIILPPATILPPPPPPSTTRRHALSIESTAAVAAVAAMNPLPGLTLDHLVADDTRRNSIEDGSYVLSLLKNRREQSSFA